MVCMVWFPDPIVSGNLTGSETEGGCTCSRYCSGARFLVEGVLTTYGCLMKGGVKELVVVGGGGAVSFRHYS